MSKKGIQMRDLYATLFYKIKFSIETINPETDLLWKLVLHVKSWMTGKHNKEGIVLSNKANDWTRIKTGGMLQGKYVKIFSEYCNVEDPFPASFWACKIVESPKAEHGIAPRQWTTEIGFEPISPQKANFSCIISYSDRPGFLGECDVPPRPSIPRVVRKIWDDPELICLDGIDKPTDQPYLLKPGDWISFWERLKNPKRSLPYIYISPVNHATGGDDSVLVNPTQLAIAAGGNAKVFYALDVGVTDEMDYYCPQSFKCYDGAIRVFYPNLDETDEKTARKHRFLSSSYIRDVVSNHIIDMIRRAIAQDANFYDALFRVEDCKKKREAIVRKTRLDELKKKHIEELATKDDQLQSVESSALELAEEAEEKQLEAEDRAANFEAENKQLKTEIFNLRSENDSYLSLAKENADLKKVCENRLSIKSYPQAPLDIVRYFESTFEDVLAFSDDAIDSIKECTIPLEDLWNTFFAFATILEGLFETGSGDIYKEFRSMSGIDVSRGEGRMTRKDKKLMRQFTTAYHGETIDIEPHITFPRIKQSIHFGYSEKDHKIIIGWCGKHKDNYSTQKVR